ncbi:MAG: T9SS type A sorting domain-containing protein [Gracilimonas sp.]|uniref:M12 family metallo-peptidase n=1 Tax=Gracilimonas TaxID=649462 RepID=UPI001B0CA129|nr:M12 family metallo-peptidase [Gracilimonas sp.]MBO6585250.1 T9SS type A sorting domain-containing protein [Gracilimonas sp.]MBO6615478.1 T9SS type A sorting domain-containing protein [Gracilimonas sp.]
MKTNAILFTFLWILAVPQHVLSQASTIFDEVERSSITNLEQIKQLDTVTENESYHQLKLVKFTKSNLSGLKRISFTPFDGSTHEFEVQTNETKRSGSHRIKGVSGNDSFAITIRGDKVTGRIHIDKKLYAIIPLGGSFHAIIEVDRSSYEPEAPPIEIDSNSAEGAFKQSKSLMSGTAIIDVLVAYTPAAGNITGIEGIIEDAILDANDSFDADDLDMEYNLVHMFELSGFSEGNDSMNQILSNFRNNTTVGDLRDQYQADLCFLITNRSDISGIAYVIENPNSGTSSFGFGIGNYDRVRDTRTFAHETGHNLGGRHNIEEDSTGTYNHGFLYDPGDWATIMSYYDLQTQERENFWSNPDKTHNGVVRGDVTYADNARKISETNTTTSEYREPQLSGTLSDDQTLNGREYVISGTLTVPSGVTFEAGPYGTIFNGVSNAQIQVNGDFIIGENSILNDIHIDVATGGELIIHEGATLSFDSGQGIEGDGVIIMDGTNPNRITLEASGGSNWDGLEINEDNSSIAYVDIEDAVNGITSYNVSGLEVQNVEVFNSTWDGFRFINTSTSSPTGGFGYLRADGNGTYGVYYDGGSNDELTNSIMVDNPSAGLFLTGGASLEGVVNSRIYDGGTNGIQANGSSYLEINSSSIHDNSYRDGYAYSSTIDATGNWWGSSFPSPSQFEEVSGGSIDYSNHLFFDPLPAGFQKRGNSSGNEPKAKTAGHAVGEINSVATLRKALSGFKGEEALTELNRISGPELPPALQQWAKVIQVELHQRLDNHQQAIETANTLLASQVTPADIRTTMGRRLFYSYLLGTQDMQAAQATLANLEQWGETEAELKQLSWLLERRKEDVQSGSTAERPQRIAQETNVQLSNYPNPFNPSTVIKYELPQNSTVRLQVFDMLGREVVTLVDQQQSPGQYSYTFDASTLSSGIYIYRLQAVNSVITKQMTLIK